MDLTTLKYEKIGYFIWVFLIIASVLEKSIVLTLINLLLGWVIPFMGVVIDILEEEI